MDEAADLAQLAELAARVRKSLHWAVFLVAMMALILVIDLQLKKSIAELATVVGRGQQAASPVAPAGGGSRDAGGNDVAGNAGLAAAGSESEDTRPAAEDHRSARPPDGPRRDGRRAGGPA